MSYDNKKRKSRKTFKKNIDEDNGLDFKESGDLIKDFEELKQCIEEDRIEEFHGILMGVGIKYFLTQNDLDYDLFKHCIKFKRERFIE
jgi:hypothetical protein